MEGYFFPQGVITQLWRSIAGKKPGVITKVGLSTFDGSENTRWKNQLGDKGRFD